MLSCVNKSMSIGLFLPIDWPGSIPSPLPSLPDFSSKKSKFGFEPTRTMILLTLTIEQDNSPWSLTYMRTNWNGPVLGIRKLRIWFACLSSNILTTWCFSIGLYSSSTSIDRMSRWTFKKREKHCCFALEYMFMLLKNHQKEIHLLSYLLIFWI